MNRKSDCCGCTACKLACPVQCIRMEPDTEGFSYPVISAEDCIHCGKCEMVCPILNPLTPQGRTQTFVGYAKEDAVRRNSSSGGIFTLAAAYVLRRGGVVFGAAFDEHFGVRHICVESEAELHRLRGSKYVQSNLDDTFAQVKKCLSDDRWVLFTGTACQIAGLKKYLGKEQEKLLTIDVLCHGVPSPKIWKQYLQEQQKAFGAEITSVHLRDKALGWKLFSVRMQFENGREYAVPFPEDPFMKLFLANIDLRPSCHDCRFKGFPRVSDITIGDCWGIDNQMPEMDDDRGTSVIIVHTRKGEELLGAIQSELVLKEAAMDRVLPRTADSRKSVEIHPNRKKFWAAVDRGENMDCLCGYVKKDCFQRVAGVLRWYFGRSRSQ